MCKIVKLFNSFVDNHLSAGLLRSIKPIDINNSEYIFIFNQGKSKFANKLYTLISHELSKHNIATCFLYKDNFLSSYYPPFNINEYKISNSLSLEKNRCVKSLHARELYFEWTVDIENEKIEANEINFFPIIENTLRMLQKRYNVFYTDDDNKPLYTDLIASCDILLKYFLLLKDFSKRHKKKIRLVGWEISYIPNGIFRILCDLFADNRDVEFIQLQRGYITYFGKYHRRESYISCSNLTKTKLSFGFVISKEELAAFDPKNIELDELFKPISNALEKPIYDEISANQKRIIKIIKDYKSRGKKVFVLFGHLFYDTPIDDKSSAFNGMCEWIRETVQYFNGNKNLLLIKPHPSEFRKDFPKKNPNETMASFLSDAQLSENIIILESRLFTVKDLSPFMSCGLIWSSSVAMELTFLGIPCIIAGNPLYSALDLYYPKTKENYFDMIKKSNEIIVPDEKKIDVSKYLYLLERHHVYVDCISYDLKLNKFYWNRKALRKYLKYGDERIQSVVENMLE